MESEWKIEKVDYGLSQFWIRHIKCGNIYLLTPNDNYCGHCYEQVPKSIKLQLKILNSK